MKKWRIVSGLLILVLILLLHLYTLSIFPQPFVDEALTLRRVASFVRTNNMDGHFYRKIYKIIGYNVEADAFLSSAIFSIGYRLIPCSELFSVRLCSLFFGFLLLFACFLITKIFTGTTAALLSIIIVSLSLPFTVSSHWARPDLMGISVGTLALAYSLYCPQGLVQGLICGFFTGIAFELHERACIAGFVIISYQVLITRFNCFKKTWIWGYILSGSICLLIYYLVHIGNSNSAALSTLYAPLAPSGFSLNLTKIFYSIVEFIGEYIEYQSSLAAFIVLIFAIPFLDKKEELKKLLLLTTLAVLASGSLIQQKVHFKIIAGTVFIDILIASLVVCFFQSLRFNRFARSVFVIFFLVTMTKYTYIAVRTYRSSTIHCSEDFKEIQRKIKPVITKEDHLMADETYWPNFSENPYTAWKVLRYYKNYYKHASIADAINFFHPDVIIVDGGMSSFLSTEPYENPFMESLRLSADELTTLLHSRAKLLTQFKSECYGEISVFRFNLDN